MRKFIPALFLVLLTAGLLTGAPLPEYKGPINDLAGMLSKGEIRQSLNRLTQY